MANKINFVTGETYSLAELFSEERRIIIPDLQRDYCWGDETNRKSSGEVGELVSDFVKNLIELYESKEQGVLNLGLFYGYEMPANHIQLCDGQQRLTTLFLLLGMLNKMSGKFRHHLISDYEYKHDDKEPYLNYAIRETSLYFLSDLVCRFFISNQDTVNKIKEADWYFADYNLDPSIQSILNALSKIESLLISKDTDWVVSFGDWVLNKLTFLYFDMQNRKNGEETFVIINTTGEPLSATQNLKPLVIQEKNEAFDNTLFCAEQPNGKSFTIDVCWEQVETWFWRKRQGSNDTADAGFAEFLRWVYMIEQYNVELSKEEQTSEVKYLIQKVLQGKGKMDFPYKEIPFSKVYEYWKSLAWIYEECDKLKFKADFLSPQNNKSVNKRKAIGQNDCFVLLPVLKYVHDKIIDIYAPSDVEKHNCVRIYEFFTNLIRVSNVSKTVNTLVGETLKIVDLIDNGDIVSILNKPNVSNQILTEEERWKLEILRNSSNREEVEDVFWKLQSHPVWNGEILPMIKMAQDNNGQFDFNKFKSYSEVFNRLFPDEMEHQIKVHLLRRSMFVSADSYEPVSRGNYVTFAWEWNDWNTILSRNIDKSRELFSYILNNIGKQPIEKISEEQLIKILEDYIKRLLDKTKENFEFAEDDYLLNFTRKSKACDMIWELEDWQICTKGGTCRHTSFFSRRNAFILKKYGANWENNLSNNKLVLEDGKWAVWYDDEYNCVVFACDRVKLKLDVRILSDKKQCEIVLKSLDNNDIDITPLAEYLNFKMREGSISEATYIHPMNSFDTSEIEIEIEKIKTTVDSIMKDITGFYHAV